MNEAKMFADVTIGSLIDLNEAVGYNNKRKFSV